ncbi:MAG: hypothetical protein NC205_06380 [Prevotella sp.]|nr:hypothetical protein [Alistipes senegalensis]MCM1358204.1 hypothetical protein [Prevotella sp.]MCM1472935.1 hypothetical protein [Muribaculaceae bacterium]
MDNLQLFMYLYMYELELWLNEHSGEVLDISFQSDEANTDRPLKEYLKSVIENKCNHIIKLQCVNYIEICDCEKQSSKYPLDYKIMSAKVERVYLPEEISPELKIILKQRKKAIFTNPDLCLVINIDGKTEYETVELKSTKTDAIPGSSVQQVSPDEWVIFVKHGKKGAQITTGQYFHAINSKMQFPDRSPRPQVSFSELQNWNDLYRKNDNTSVTYNSAGDESIKYELLTDWQGVLAKRWTEVVLNNNPQNHEPWFNNNLRKFILEFLSCYDEMSPDAQKKYKEFLADIIK